MGYILRREIRALIPPGKLSQLERNIVLEIADQCDDDTRKTWPGVKLLQLLVDKNNRAIEEALARIADKWVELRVELGKGSDGRPYYSHRGKATTFCFPPDADLRKAYEKATGIPWASSEHAQLPGAIRKPKQEKVPKKAGASARKPPDFSEEAPGFSGESPRENRGPSPQGSSPQNFNTSSLSSEDRSVAAARDDVEDRERDEVTSSEDPKPQPLPAPERMLAKRGIHGEEAQYVIRFIEANVPSPIQGDGWWYRADGNGSLDDWILKARDALTRPADIQSASHTGPRCDTCWGSGLLTTDTGDIDCPACTPATGDRISTFKAQLVGQPDCGHGYDGGNIPMAGSGWMHCPRCRQASGYVPLEERNRQGRTSERDNLPAVRAAPDWQPHHQRREGAQARKASQYDKIDKTLNAYPVDVQIAMLAQACEDNR
ncbi:hypothetical protein ACIBCR_15480 [Micromonospora echinospora]|uniref:hypothetical protein n=1 Tax=Micromonospora echinospora TaxID=1877 RepID=UPI0037AAEB81